MRILRKKESGITLVALTVTIIILLILAGVAISQLTGNGLFENAKLAKEKTKNAQIEEDAILDDYENSIQDIIVGSRDTVTISKEEYDILKNSYTYSEDEKVVGEWIDGKKIYQKVFKINHTVVSGIGWKSIDLELSKYNIADIISSKFYTSNGYTGGNGSSMTNFLVCSVGEDENIRFYLNTNDTIGIDTIILQYTKTTD